MVMQYPDPDGLPVQRVQLSCGPLVYRVVGSGPPLILLHGWGGSSRHWFMTMPAMADMRTIYALDLPGHGQSPALDELSSAERLAAVVVEFADVLGLESFDLNGHSFGGAVAAYVAADYPDRVRHLVLTSFGRMGTDVGELFANLVYLQSYVPLQLWHPWLGLFRPVQNLWQQSMVNVGQLSTLPWIMARPFLFNMPDDWWILQEGYNDFVGMDMRSSLENVFSLGNPRLRRALSELPVPTLLISGQQDQIVPTILVMSAEQIIPNNTLKLLDHCGHVPMLERPNIYSQVVREFLEKAPAKAERDVSQRAA